MKPRAARPRNFGCPDRLLFDDPEKLEHFLSRSVDTMQRYERKYGLRIHTWRIGGKNVRGVIVSEFWAWFDAHEVVLARDGELGGVAA